MSKFPTGVVNSETPLVLLISDIIESIMAEDHIDSFYIFYSKYLS